MTVMRSMKKPRPPSAGFQYQPLAIGGRHYVDGALKKTLNASLALEDGAQLVIGVNPLVPYDADAANRRLGKHGKAELGKLVIIDRSRRPVMTSLPLS